MKDTPPPTPPPKPSIHLDWEEWLPDLEDSNATEAEKRQLIETLWFILCCIADYNAQVANDAETSGQPIELAAALQAIVVNSKDTPDEQEAL